MKYKVNGHLTVDECWHFDNDGVPDNLSIESA